MYKVTFSVFTSAVLPPFLLAFGFFFPNASSTSDESFSSPSIMQTADLTLSLTAANIS